MGEKYKLEKMVAAKGLAYELKNTSGKPISEVNRFLDCVSLMGASINTVVSYGYDLLNFYTWLDESKMKLDKLAEYDLYQYIAYQKEENAAPRSINRRLATIMQFYRFLFGKDMPGGRHVLRPAGYYKGRNISANMGVIPQKRTRRPLRVKVPHKLQVPLTVDEVKKYLESIKRYRDLAIVYMMLHCGVRSIEILNLRTSDISYMRRQALIRGKGNKQRMMFLPAHVIQMLEKYLKYEKPKDSAGEALFVVLKGKTKGQPMTRAGLRKIFRYRRKISGVKRANPHRWRHTFAVDMLNAGVSLRVVQELLGHEDINMTINYSNISQKDIRDEFLNAAERIKDRYGQKKK